VRRIRRRRAYPHPVVGLSMCFAKGDSHCVLIPRSSHRCIPCSFRQAGLARTEKPTETGAAAPCESHPSPTAAGVAYRIPGASISQVSARAGPILDLPPGLPEPAGARGGREAAMHPLASLNRAVVPLGGRPEAVVGRDRLRLRFGINEQPN